MYIKIPAVHKSVNKGSFLFSFCSRSGSMKCAFWNENEWFPPKTKKLGRQGMLGQRLCVNMQKINIEWEQSGGLINPKQNDKFYV